MAPQCFWCSLCRLGGVARLLLSTTCSVPVHDEGSLSQVLPKSLLALQDTLLKIAIIWEVDPEAQQGGTDPQPPCLTRWVYFAALAGDGRSQITTRRKAPTGETKLVRSPNKCALLCRSARCLGISVGGYPGCQGVKTVETLRRT